MAVETAAAFLEVLQKSRILKGDQLGIAREAAPKAADARALARALVHKELLTRWQAGQLLAGRTAFLLGKYRLVDLLGRGGMGNVFLAWHTMMNRFVALKVISRQLGDDHTALERFFTEARAVAALDHPNIVHAYDIANEGNRYYMVLEYVEGRDLKRMVEADGPLDFASAVDYIRQAAEGLAHAHGKDMIHCDIKPANLLVSRQGVVKILDMGMARAVGRKTGETGEGAAADDQTLLGTVDYMAPELAMGFEKLDRRSDIYSLGCTFYFTLTGRPPFPEGTLAERILKHQTEEPADIAQARPDAPPELVRICRKMMAKEPDDRFQTADEVAGVLAEWRPPQTKILRATPLEDGEAGEEEAFVAIPARAARADGARPKQSLGARWLARAKQAIGYVLGDRRRRMIAAGVAGAAVLLVVCGLIWWVVSAVKAEQQRYAAEQLAAQQADKPKSDDEFGDLKFAWEEPGAGKTGTAPRAVKARVSAPPSKPGGPPAKPGSLSPKPGSPRPKPGGSSPSPVKTAPPAGASKTTPKPKAAPSPATAAARKTAKAGAGAKAAGPRPAAPAKAPSDPLAGFPTLVELPPIGEAGAGESPAGPTLLGKIQGPLDAPISIGLLGKGTALRGKRQFTFEHKDDGGKRQLWIVGMAAPGKEDAPAEVARLVRDKDGLKFRWSEGAAGASGEFLRNCALKLRAGGPAHVVLLRKTEIVKPAVFDLQKGISVATAPIEFLPDAADIRVEFGKIDTPAGPVKMEYLEGPVFRPSNIVGFKTPVTLAYARRNLLGQFMPVEFVVRAIPKGRGLAIEIRLVSPKPQEYKNILTYAAETRINAEQQIRGLPEQFAAAKEDRQKVEIAKKFDRFAVPLWYEEFYRQMNRNARLHFRVFIEAKKKQIDLARTETPK